MQSLCRCAGTETKSDIALIAAAEQAKAPQFRYSRPESRSPYISGRFRNTIKPFWQFGTDCGEPPDDQFIFGRRRYLV